MEKNRLLEVRAKDSRVISRNELLERERLSALAQGDPVSYVNLCNSLGVVDPEDSDLYDKGMADILIGQKGIGRFVGLAKARKPVKKPEKSAAYKVLYEVAMEVGVNPDNVFVDSDTKRRLLREYMGYTKLVSGRGERVSIDDARDTRVGAVFRDCFYRGRDVYIRG